MKWANDFNQWPTSVKLTMPIWLPLFLVVATVFYAGCGIAHALDLLDRKIK